MVDRIQVSWQNWPGAPGVSTFYGDATLGMLDGISSFFDAIKGLLPLNLTITVPSTGDDVDPQTGEVVGSWSQAPTTPVRTGSNVAVYAGSTGAVVHWRTGGVVGGRRVRGRTFLVPLVGAYDSGGSLSSGAISTLQTAANGLVSTAGSAFSVWHRPTQFVAGSTHQVTSASVPDLAVVLRSRRT